jgi:type IV secretory pathway VirB10-like protein
MVTMPPETLRMLRWAGIGLGTFFGLIAIFVVLLRNSGGAAPPKLPDSEEGKARVVPASVVPIAAQIVASTQRIELAPRPGTTERRTVVLTATGGVAAAVGPVRSPSSALRFDGDCLALRNGWLQAGASCTLGITADAGSALATLVTVDHGGALRATEIQVERIQPPEPVATAAAAQPVPRMPTATEQLAAWQLMRQSTQMPRVLPNGSAAEPSTPHYNAAFRDRAIPSAKFTRPVDRSRIITQDRIIKAVLQTPITSSMPGRVIAHVTRPVRSPDTGEVLIPAGTSVLGTSGGDLYRTGVLWQRMLMPDGASVTLEGAIAADKMGRPGLPAEVYTQFWDRFGSAMATSLVNFAATGYLAGNDSSTVTDGVLGSSRQETPRQEAARQLRRDFADVTRQLAAEGARQQPIGIVAGGTELDIVLGQDLYIPRLDEPEGQADGVQMPLNAGTTKSALGEGATRALGDATRAVSELPIRALPAYDPAQLSSSARDLLPR